MGPPLPTARTRQVEPLYRVIRHTGFSYIPGLYHYRIGTITRYFILSGVLLNPVFHYIRFPDKSDNFTYRIT
jgi:hypothetical protein